MEYTIGKVERTSFLDSRGRAVDGYRVWYTLENGIVDYVEIEKSQYNAESVKAAIEADKAEHEAVLG
jgi:hypothetical protein